MLPNSRQMDNADCTKASAPPASDLVKDALYFRYRLIEFVTEHLIDLSQSFEGDLQQVLVLAIIGQVYVNQLLKSGNKHGETTHSISASRIADITRIPRQTVRRKLETLEKRGWIAQDDQRSWHIVVREGVAAAQSDLAHLDARGIRRGARLAEAYKMKEASVVSRNSDLLIRTNSETPPLAVSRDECRARQGRAAQLTRRSARPS